MKNGLIIESKIFNIQFLSKHQTGNTCQPFETFLRQVKLKLEQFRFTSCSPNKFRPVQLLRHQFLWLLAIRRAQGLKKGP